MSKKERAMFSKKGDELSRSLYKDAMVISGKLGKQIGDLAAILSGLEELFGKLERRITVIEDDREVEKRGLNNGGRR